MGALKTLIVFRPISSLIGTLPSWYAYRQSPESSRMYRSISCKMAQDRGWNAVISTARWSCHRIQRLVFHQLRQDEAIPIRFLHHKTEKVHKAGKPKNVHFKTCVCLSFPVTPPPPCTLQRETETRKMPEAKSNASSN